jgi:RND family efflux transporter MFP subunit
MRSIRWLLLTLPWLVVLGCGNESAMQSGQQKQQVKAAAVQISEPIARSVTEYEEFTGMTQAVQTIEIRARVSGYLDKVNFRDGAEVQKDHLLFEIDPRPYQAMLNQAKAKVAQDEAQLTFDEADYQRNLKLVGTGSVSRSDLDKSAAARGVDVANVAADKAVVAARELDLEYTKVHAPISGRISKRMIDPGNMVKADETPLTTIVSLDPIFAYFDVDEGTELRLRRLALGGKLESLADRKMQIELALADEEGYPHPGTVDFADNQIDANTGTLRMRGVFSNSDGLLAPGRFVRVRLPVGTPHAALLVAEQALGRDQSQKYVFVVTPENKVEYRRIKVGRLYDGLREVTEGLKPGERVIVNGLQRVRPDVVVEPEVVTMPTPDESKAGNQGPAFRNQKSEVRAQRPEIRGQ